MRACRPGVAPRLNRGFMHMVTQHSKARKAGKCVETKFRIIGPEIVTAKVLRC